ncbi:MAG: hypothetical protein R2789_07185 [Microthrixaceae bacterium]
MASKAQRQHRIGELLASQRVSSQSQLVELLEEAGTSVNQATVSRDLDELGAIKVRVPGARRCMPYRSSACAVRAGGPPAQGALRLGRGDRPRRRSGRGAHPAGISSRRRFSHRPQRSR